MVSPSHVSARRAHCSTRAKRACGLGTPNDAAAKSDRSAVADVRIFVSGLPLLRAQPPQQRKRRRNKEPFRRRVQRILYEARNAVPGLLDVLSDRVDREPDVSGVRQKRRDRHLADFESKLKLVSGLRPRRQPKDKRGENEVDDCDDCGRPDEPIGGLQPIEACDIRHAQPEHGDQRREDEKPEPPRNDVEPDAPDERIRFPQDLQDPHENNHHGPSPYRRPSILPMIMPTTMPPIAIARGCAPISFSLSSRNLADSLMSSPIWSCSFSLSAAPSGAAAAIDPVGTGSAIAGDGAACGFRARRAVESSSLSDCNSSSIADLEAIGVSRACYCGVSGA